MRSVPIGILCSAAAFASAAPALAASDYYLVIDGVEGEATTAIEVQSWSWGTSNSGAAARDSGPRVTASQNTQSLRESPTRGTLTASQNSQELRESPTRASTGRDVSRGQSTGQRSAGGVSVAAGDLDGDGRADLTNLATLDEVGGFTLTLAPGPPETRAMCVSGKHIKHAHLVGPQGVIDFEDLVISSCSGGGGAGGMTMAVSGTAKEFKGHVTLLK